MPYEIYGDSLFPFPCVMFSYGPPHMAEQKKKQLKKSARDRKVRKLPPSRNIFRGFTQNKRRNAV